jgi:hypothetical protein
MKITFLLLLISSLASAQISVVSKNNFNFVKGIYTKKSTSTTALNAAETSIPPQITLNSSENRPAFLFPPKSGILLFETKNLNDLQNVAGKLSTNSVVKIDTIFYNQAYRSISDNAFTFDICYALTINDKHYYTDFRPHDFVPFQYPLQDLNQVVFLAGQSTGYDMYADNGYPDHFQIIVFSKTENPMHLQFVSGELPFDFENEFWEQNESMKSAYDAVNKQFNIEINGKPHYKASWDGKNLKQISP